MNIKNLLHYLKTTRYNYHYSEESGVWRDDPIWELIAFYVVLGVITAGGIVAICLTR